MNISGSYYTQHNHGRSKPLITYCYSKRETLVNPYESLQVHGVCSILCIVMGDCMNICAFVTRGPCLPAMQQYRHFPISIGRSVRRVLKRGVLHISKCWRAGLHNWSVQRAV